MTVFIVPPPVIRVPNVPTGAMVNEDGTASVDELSFRTTLISSLQQNYGNEGLVIPTQYNLAAPQDLVTQIQNHYIQSDPTSPRQYTCQLGTMLYVIADPADYTQDKVMIAVRNDNTYPATPPLFKTVTLT